MAAPARSWAAELLHFWFHRLTPVDWFTVSEALDAELRRRFDRHLAMLGHRPAGDFLDDAQTALAAILLFDQLPRNIHRGDASAYRNDPLARAITHAVMARGWDARLALAQRQFAYMPLMHSEQIVDQQLSLAMFVRLPRRYGWPFAVSHHAVIARFGRFPHRNAVLGRKSSPAEKAAIAAGAAW